MCIRDSLRNDRLVIVSQTSSLLWVGELAQDDWEVFGDGQLYRFPQDRTLPRYRSIEGVVWLDARTVACVSDRGEEGDAKDQSVHVFRLPD